MASQEKTAKRFSFYETATLENLDAESKKEIIFGRKITDLFSKPNLGKIQRLAKASTPTPIRKLDDQDGRLSRRRRGQEEHADRHQPR